MSEVTHKEQPSNRLIVRFRLFPQKDSLEERADFFSLKIPSHNGNEPKLAPHGMISIGLIDALEKNPRCFVFNDAVYTRSDGKGATKKCVDEDGKNYLERTYVFDIVQTSHYKRNNPNSCNS